MFRKFSWIVLVLAVILGVHFALQAIIQSGDAKNRKGPDLARLKQMEATDPAHAARIRAGMIKYESICRLCHHSTGQGGKFSPPVAGKTAEGIELMLKLYREGVQVGPLTNLMAPWAADLSDEDIRNLASYVESL